MTTRIDIEAIGNFLATYETDLIYIRNFMWYRQGRISPDDFIKKENGSFYSFLIEFNVTRNFMATKSREILECSNDWLNRGNDEDVDGLAMQLKVSELTRNGIMTSLASKILFLNNPYKIFPMDRRAKKTLNYNKDNIYKNYLPEVKKYIDIKSDLILNALNLVEPFAEIIESNFIVIPDIPTIRRNRFIDKLLWTGAKSPVDFFKLGLLNAKL